MKKEKSAAKPQAGKQTAAQEQARENSVSLSTEELAKNLETLDRATTTLQQVGGIFTLCQYLSDGDNRVSHERRFEDVINALNEIGVLGDALITQAFGDVVDVHHKLRQYRSQVSEAGKAVAQ